jgi:predicted glycoside hydrolase/deacetylase ChbG (UPF0249 family)
METKKIREKIIISADDFDSHPEAKKNILLLAEAGKIDRVGVIIDEHFTSEEITRLLRSGIKIDLHLMLVGIKANHHSYGESALKRSLIFVVKYFLGNITSTQTEEEWARQIEKFKTTFGRKPDGINSHQHVHFFPPFFKIILILAEKNNISYVRFGEKFLSDGHPLIYYILSVLNKKNRPRFHASGLQSANYMASLDWIRNFEKFTNNLPGGGIELVCHPERKEEFELIQKYF